jgi:hypothetical protein
MLLKFIVPGQIINFADWADYYAFDVMGELAFNKDFGLITGGRSMELTPRITS